MSELRDQLPLYEDIRVLHVTGEHPNLVYQWTDRVTGHIPWRELPFSREEELCEQCGTACTSSKECVEISGLYDEED